MPRQTTKGLLQFSLQTLLLLVLCISSYVFLYMNGRSWVCEFSTALSSRINAATFSPDGKQLFLATDDSRLRIWSIAGLKGDMGFGPHPLGIKSVEVSTDGQKMLTVGVDGRARIWDHFERSRVCVLEDIVLMGVAKFHPSGARVAAIDELQGVHIANSDEGKRLSELCDGTYGLSNGCFSRNGRTLAAFGKKEIVLFDLGANAKKVLRGHSQPVVDVAFSDDGKWLASGGVDQTVRLWDTESGASVRIWCCSGMVGAVRFSPANDSILVACFEDGAHLWRISDGSLLQHFKGSNFLGAEFSPDAERVLTYASDGSLQLWSTESGKELYSFSAQRYYPIWWSGFSPVGRRIAFFTGDGLWQVWRNQRPEPFWGICCLPSFWLAVFFSAWLIANFVRFRRARTKQANVVA